MSKKYIVFFIMVAFTICSFAMVTNAVSAEKIELRFAHHDPPTGPGGRSTAMWAKKVEEVTGGRVKITMYPASHL
jgi:TRAP-type C4-dicarboxylate transport system substrate-binding protein